MNTQPNATDGQDVIASGSSMGTSKKRNRSGSRAANNRTRSHSAVSGQRGRTGGAAAGRFVAGAGAAQQQQQTALIEGQVHTFSPEAFNDIYERASEIQRLQTELGMIIRQDLRQYGRQLPSTGAKIARNLTGLVAAAPGEVREHAPVWTGR